ncbi:MULTISPECIES: gamma carbonic anhydrase family protein [Halomonas]|uniref:Gamma carbonic anhydrase family protein n=1 Tax=Halomonas binhaiensis TaxID=2562282 RepID=A0A5C1NHS9_9GAMM|nr:MULTISPECIES: gamma carbonic anhydrase family protein [Halomonas]QEM82844.1 gamma carbonic anhydrase family protein [Halomonas binhaiensis]
MAIYRLGNHSPQIHRSAYVAESAEVIGQVRIFEDASIWYQAVLRGDTDSLEVGRGSNIQDGAVLHADPGTPLVVGEGVTVGHQAMLHGCTIGDGSLIGIQAVILNGAVIGRNCLVAAGAVVKENAEFPENSLIVGAPAKVIRQLDEKAVAELQANAEGYVKKARLHRTQLARIG